MKIADRLRRLRSAAARLRKDRNGVAMIEFAFTAPIVLGIGCFAIETANLALMNMRVSQIALNLADNASRVGTYSSLSNQQLREVDINDVIQAARYQGQGIKLTTQGRIILSSLENVQQGYDLVPVQRIHWQRCVGLAGSGGSAGDGYNSSYGTTSTSAGTTSNASDSGTLAPLGIGDAGSQVNAPVASGVMFVEINYLVKPVVSSVFLPGSPRIHYIASFIVRDKRDFAQLYNPSPTATKATCNLYGS